VVLFFVAFLGLALYALLRNPGPPEPAIVLEGPQAIHVTLRELRELPAIEREGTYQNLYGNWRDHGVYKGVPLPTLIEAYFGDLVVTGVTVIGRDGYQVQFPAGRLYDPDYPVVLAYALDGVEPPAWEDGPRIAVLPEDGDVSNAEYRADSAGAFWVKNVVRIVVETAD
jgi:hypothetical protein